MVWIIIGVVEVAIILIYAVWFMNRSSNSGDGTDGSGYSCSYCGGDYGCRCLG